MYQKNIQYDLETHDYAMYLDGELVGFARNYSEAETTLDELIHELICAESRLGEADEARQNVARFGVA